MLRIAVSIVVGLAGGILLGSLAAYCLHPTGAFSPLPDDKPGWTDYPTIDDAVRQGQPVLWQKIHHNAGDFRYWMFFGVVCGGGFGMVTGSVVGATAILTERLGQLQASK